MKRPTLREAGLWLAWLLFLVANACPAVAVDMGAWNSPEPKFIPGYFCTLLTWPFWLSNAVLLLLPLLLAFDPVRTWVRRLKGSLVALLVVSLIGGLGLLGTFRAVHVGYWLWETSFLVAAASCAPWRPTRRPSRV